MQTKLLSKCEKKTFKPGNTPYPEADKANQFYHPSRLIKKKKCFKAEFWAVQSLPDRPRKRQVKFTSVHFKHNLEVGSDKELMTC